MAHTSRHNELHCRACGSAMDCATDVLSNQEPYDGAFSLCVMCGELSVFVVGVFGVSLRKPTMEELAEAARNSEFQLMREALTYAHAHSSVRRRSKE